MRVVVPFVNLSAGTRFGLKQAGVDYEAIDVSGSEDAYFDLLSGLWADGEEFCIVEHDIVVWNTTLEDLEDCPHEWCAASYQYVNGYYHGLGCMKFGAHLLAAHPTAMEEVGLIGDATHPPKHWCRLDGWLNVRVLQNIYHEQLHRHDDQLVHLQVNPGHSGHGCI